jgi:hypothetical protein
VYVSKQNQIQTIGAHNAGAHMPDTRRDIIVRHLNNNSMVSRLNNVQGKNQDRPAAAAGQPGRKASKRFIQQQIKRARLGPPVKESGELQVRMDTGSRFHVFNTRTGQLEDRGSASYWGGYNSQGAATRAMNKINRDQSFIGG